MTGKHCKGDPLIAQPFFAHSPPFSRTRQSRRRHAHKNRCPFSQTIMWTKSFTALAHTRPGARTTERDFETLNLRFRDSSTTNPQILSIGPSILLLLWIHPLPSKMDETRIERFTRKNLQYERCRMGFPAS